MSKLTTVKAGLRTCGGQNPGQNLSLNKCSKLAKVSLNQTAEEHNTELENTFPKSVDLFSKANKL